MNRARASSLLAVAVSVALASAALADGGKRDRDDADRALEGARSGELLPIAGLMKSVLAAYPGQIVETELEEDDGTVYYEFYVLRSDGRVIEVKVDARDGRILSAEADD